MKIRDLKIQMLILHECNADDISTLKHAKVCWYRCLRSDITSFVIENLEGMNTEELHAIRTLKTGEVYHTGGGGFASYNIEMVEGLDAIREYQVMKNQQKGE